MEEEKTLFRAACRGQSQRASEQPSWRAALAVIAWDLLSGGVLAQRLATSAPPAWPKLRALPVLRGKHRLRGKGRREPSLAQVQTCERSLWLQCCEQLCLQVPIFHIICDARGYDPPLGSLLAKACCRLVLPCTGSFPSCPGPVAPPNCCRFIFQVPFLPSLSLRGSRAPHFEQVLEEKREWRVRWDQHIFLGFRLMRFPSRDCS